MIHLTRRPARRIAAVAAAGAAALAVAACGSSTSSHGNDPAGSSGGGHSASLRIGYIADVHGAGLIESANKNGFWAKAGVDPHISAFDNGPDEITAMEADKLDIAYIGPGALYSAMAGKVDVIAIDSTSSADALVVNPSTVPDLAALKGKTIGYAEGTSSQMILDLALEKAGLSTSDVKLTPLDDNLIPTAFLSGKIQVASPFPAGTQQILAKDKSAKVLASDSNFAPKYIFPEVWVASPSLVKQHPAEVVAFLKAEIMANDWRRQNLKAAISMSAKDAESTTGAQAYLSQKTDWLSSRQILADNAKGTTNKWFTALNHLFLVTKQATKVASPASYDNTALYKQAYAAVNR